MSDPEVYISFDETPLDEPGPTGDQTLLADAPWANPHAAPLDETTTVELRTRLEKAAVMKISKPAPAKLVVPHPRDLSKGDVGWDVYALQRALSTAGLRPWGTFTRTYGPGTLKEVKTFQQRNGLHVDGVYGLLTHKKLAKYYDAYGIRLLNRVHIKTPAEIRKGNLLTAAMVMYNRRGIVHYTQGPGRMWIVDHRYKLADLTTMSQDWEDCSSSVTGLRYVSGLNDPNGFNFNGYGFTGTIAAHGESIPASQAKVGALYLYGSYPYHHVTMNVGANRCFSHGSEDGPSLIDPFYSAIGDVRVYPGLP